MRLFAFFGALLLASTVGSIRPAEASTIFLDADTVATGSQLGVSPLLVPDGTITFVGEIRDRGNDPDFNAAGASGNVFDIGGTGGSTATLSFSFDVSSISFIYGGNLGVFDVVARDAANNTVDSFFQASTADGQPAGPIVLSGLGIRSLFWQDPDGSFAPIDNVTIETAAAAVPEPTSLLLLGTGVAGLFNRTRRRKK